MRNITNDELQEILKLHSLWLKGEGGERADLSEADLSRADLRSTTLFLTKLVNIKY